jgi:hypothetical protein
MVAALIMERGYKGTLAPRQGKGELKHATLVPTMSDFPS